MCCSGPPRRRRWGPGCRLHRKKGGALRKACPPPPTCLPDPPPPGPCSLTGAHPGGKQRRAAHGEGGRARAPQAAPRKDVVAVGAGARLVPWGRRRGLQGALGPGPHTPCLQLPGEGSGPGGPGAGVAPKAEGRPCRRAERLVVSRWRPLRGEAATGPSLEGPPWTRGVSSPPFALG